jgi:hypothetical protein
MLKQAPNFVLGSTRSSTWPRGYASGLVFASAALDSLFEYPKKSGKKKRPWHTKSKSVHSKSAQVIGSF